MKKITHIKNSNLKELINNINIGVYSVLIEDVDNLFITSDKYPETLVKPSEDAIHQTTLQQIVEHFSNKNQKIEAIESSMFNYIFCIMRENEIICLSIDEVILQEENPYSLTENVWDLNEIVSDNYQPNIVEELKDFEIDQKIQDLDDI